MTYITLAEQRHRRELAEITEQLRELLEVIEAGDIETATTWVRAAIEVGERRTKPDASRRWV